MKLIKELTLEFLNSKQAKRAFWTVINVLMGLAVSYITYLAGADIAWAVAVLPFVTALFQLITKELNQKTEVKEAE